MAAVVLSLAATVNLSSSPSPPLGCRLGFVIVIMWLLSCDRCCACQRHCHHIGGEPWRQHLHGYQCWADLSRASEWLVTGVVTVRLGQVTAVGQGNLII